jgi:hypothetical protein
MEERDLVRLLRESHEVAQWLADRLGDADFVAARKFYKDQLTNVLGGHLSAIEGSVLPAAQSRGWKGVRSTTLVAHFDLKAMVAQLVVTEPDGDRFAEVVARLQQLLRREQQAVQHELLPAVVAALSPEERRQLSAEVDLHLARSVGTPLAAMRDPTALPALDVIEEARVVLSSLADPLPDTA